MPSLKRRLLTASRDNESLRQLTLIFMLFFAGLHVPIAKVQLRGSSPLVPHICDKFSNKVDKFKTLTA